MTAVMRLAEAILQAWIRIRSSIRLQGWFESGSSKRSALMVETSLSSTTDQMPAMPKRTR